MAQQIYTMKAKVVCEREVSVYAENATEARQMVRDTWANVEDIGEDYWKPALDKKLAVTSAIVEGWGE